jgi:putative endonuclease
MVQVQEEEQKPPSPVAFFCCMIFKTVMSYCIYILYSQRIDKFYTGMTKDLEQRIFQHNNPISQMKYTAKGIPWQLYITISCNDKPHALKLEKLIKARRVVHLFVT